MSCHEVDIRCDAEYTIEDEIGWRGGESRRESSGGRAHHLVCYGSDTVYSKMEEEGRSGMSYVSINTIKSTDFYFHLYIHFTKMTQNGAIINTIHFLLVSLECHSP